MFHSMLVLFPVLLAYFIACIMLGGIAAIIIGIVGGASATLFIKNEVYKHLLFIGSGIFASIGFSVLIPFIFLYMDLPWILYRIVSLIFSVLSCFLCIAGISRAGYVEHKIGKAVLYIVFSLVLIISVILFLLVLYLGSLFTPK